VGLRQAACYFVAGILFCSVIAGFAAPAHAVEIPPSVREYAARISELIPETTLGEVMSRGTPSTLRELVPAESTAWRQAWRFAPFEDAARASADTMTARGSTVLDKWFDFASRRIQKSAAIKLRRMMCTARLASARLPGRQYVRADWVYEQLRASGLPMSDASTQDIASWLTRRINDPHTIVSLACMGWARFASR
jgi:hypothetical protein